MNETVSAGVRARSFGARAREVWGAKKDELTMTGLRIAIGLIWLNSFWGKFTNPNFVASFTATNKTFAGKTSFGWYHDFLVNTVIPNAAFWANLTMYAELLAGIALVAGLLTNLGAIGAFLLNLNFWLAASNTSPSTASVNIAMGAAAIIFLLAPAAKYYSVDRLLAERFLTGFASKHPKLTTAFIGPKVRV